MKLRIDLAGTKHHIYSVQRCLVRQKVRFFSLYLKYTCNLWYHCQTTVHNWKDYIAILLQNRRIDTYPDMPYDNNFLDAFFNRNFIIICIDTWFFRQNKHIIQCILLKSGITSLSGLNENGHKIKDFVTSWFK